jgi:ATP-dependent RNA helicase RhlE
MKFEELKIIEPLLKAVEAQGYDAPTPIQELAIPHVLAGRDVMGCAQTGTGKTAAFALPILQRLHQTPLAHGKRRIRSLVLAPTRELATQIGASFAAYGAHLPLRHTVVFGGVRQRPQTKALGKGVDILVATPGRLLDLMGQGFIELGAVEILVLDEGDRMLDMGFIRDIRRIVAATPRQRQTLLFSATLSSAVRDLESGMLRDPVEVAVAPSATTVEGVEQLVYFVERMEKTALLAHLMRQPNVTRALVFVATRQGADQVTRQLVRAGVPADVLHADRSQKEREAALEAFKTGRTRVLIATDIAARGLDIEQISHVVNYELPRELENYVHRIGRTARAGESGVALSFCAVDEREDLRAIEKLIRRELTVVADHPFAWNPTGAGLGKPLPGVGRRMPSRSARRAAWG